MNQYPKYEPMKWNKDYYIRKSHNCYAYALNLIYPKYIELCKNNNIDDDEFCKFVRPQPGLYSGYKKFKKNSNIEKRMIKDNPSIIKTEYNILCPRGYYKIALVIEKNNKKNYHFYREDKNKLWSHKDGWTKATNKDINGNLIYDPYKCDRGVYDFFIGYYMVPIDPKLKNMTNYFT